MKTTFLSYLELVYELTLKEIRARYKQSVLGYAWVILAPLFQMLAMSFVFSIVLRVADHGLPYPLFLYTGLLPWILVSQTLTSSSTVLVLQAKLISKIYFPREVLVLSTLLAKLVDFALSALIWLGFLWYYQVPLSWQMLWFFPILMIQLLFTYGLSLLLAAANLFYRDIQYLLNLVVLIWMYLTPVVYPIDLVPQHLRWFFIFNPMAFCVDAFRMVLLQHQAPDFGLMLITLVYSLIVFLVGWFTFKKLEVVFADFA